MSSLVRSSQRRCLSADFKLSGSTSILADLTAVPPSLSSFAQPVYKTTTTEKRFRDTVAWERPVAWVLTATLLSLAATGIAGFLAARDEPAHAIGSDRAGV